MSTWGTNIDYRAGTHLCMCTHMHTRVHACAGAHMHANTCAYLCRSTHVHTHIHVYAHTQMHIYHHVILQQQVTTLGQDLQPAGWSSLTRAYGASTTVVWPGSPVQSQGMKERREALHDQKDGYCQNGKYGKNDKDPNESSPASQAKADVHHHGPEHLRQFCKSKRNILF